MTKGKNTGFGVLLWQASQITR